MTVSVVVPARNERDSIGRCLAALRTIPHIHHIPCEIIVVDDGSTDGTGQIVRDHMNCDPAIRLVERTPPCGFGRAVRAGLDVVSGDIVVICMADGSDDVGDVVRYVRTIEEGCDCVFGSRFIDGARVVNYPPVKRLLNRLGNRGLQLLFRTDFNDLTNAFKAYRTRVIRECGPFTANHFDLTLEIALAALRGPYSTAQIPIAWTGRTAGTSKLNLPVMSVRYLAVAAAALMREMQRERTLRVLQLVSRWCVYAAIAASAVRAGAYLCYAAWHFSFPFETHALEATMVHHAWRVMNGSVLYPAWTDYPHVTNFFAPLYFWIVGSLGRLAGASVRDLFLIGRSIAFLSTLCATAGLAWYLLRRHGRGAALVGALLSLGAAPLYGFSIMTRPDAMADAAGVAGLLLATVDSRRATIAAAALLAIAILAKQTAGIYLVAALLLCLGNRRFAQAAWLAAASTFTLAGVAVVLTSAEPLFLDSVFQERRAPLSFVAWMTAMGQVVRRGLELLVLPVAGILVWIRQKNHGWALAAGTLLAGSLVTALKVGADLNYFLPLRTASVIAAGSLWAVWRDAAHKRQVWVAAVTAGVLLLLLPASVNAVRAAREASTLRAFIESAPGALALENYDELIRLVQRPDIRVLTDSGILALYQKDRAPFVDPWLFRLLVTTDRIQPIQMEHWLESEAYDFLVLTADLHSAAYDSYSFGLPPPLVERARAHYQKVGRTAGLFIYRPRRTS